MTEELKREEILRILSFQDLAYYEILGVSDHVYAKDIHQAFRRKAGLIQNSSDPFAQQAFRRLSTAYEVLYDEKMRREYDRIRSSLEKAGLLDRGDLGESFERGAYAYDLDESGDESEDDEPPKSEEKVAMLLEMGPYVETILVNPSDNDALKTLEELNGKMIKLNQAQGIFATSHTIPLRSIQKIGNEQTLLRQLLEDERNDRQTVEDGLWILSRKLKKLLNDFDLPESWTFL